MDVKTKFGIHQKIYVISNDKIWRTIIRSAIVVIPEVGNHYVTYELSAKELRGPFHERELYSTFEEAKSKFEITIIDRS